MILPPQSPHTHTTMTSHYDGTSSCREAKEILAQLSGPLSGLRSQ